MKAVMNHTEVSGLLQFEAAEMSTRRETSLQGTTELGIWNSSAELVPKQRCQKQNSVGDILTAAKDP
jgi:hypothetical protein